MSTVAADTGKPQSDQSAQGAQQELASMIHDELCNDTPGCARGESHQQYYRDRAGTIIDRLEPEIGMANVRLAVSVIIDELW
jgi:hypothetical protein